MSYDISLSLSRMQGILNLKILLYFSSRWNWY